MCAFVYVFMSVYVSYVHAYVCSTLRYFLGSKCAQLFCAVCEQCFISKLLQNRVSVCIICCVRFVCAEARWVALMQRAKQRQNSIHQNEAASKYQNKIQLNFFSFEYVFVNGCCCYYYCYFIQVLLKPELIRS